jgi:flagellar assembly protein FliH
MALLLMHEAHMIVRDAIVSDEPYTLGGAGSAGLVKVPRPAPAPRLEPVLSPAICIEAASRPPIEPMLTPARVAAWLADQDRDVLISTVPGLMAELAEIREDAHTAGFNAGQLEGRVAAHEQTAQLQVILKGVVDGLRAQYQDQQAQLATHCVEIVATALGKIAGPLLATRDAALGAVIEALRRARAGEELTLHVHPAEHAWLETEREQLTAVVSAPLTLLADARVALGGCRIESLSGTLDARLEVQLQELFETLRAAQGEARKS